MVESDDDDAGNAKFKTPTVKLGKKGEPLALCGRPAFSANPVNKKYNSRYRNSENQNRRLLDLGRATGIIRRIRETQKRTNKRMNVGIILFLQQSVQATRF